MFVRWQGSIFHMFEYRGEIYTKYCLLDHGIVGEWTGINEDSAFWKWFSSGF